MVAQSRMQRISHEILKYLHRVAAVAAHTPHRTYLHAKYATKKPQKYFFFMIASVWKMNRNMSVLSGESGMN